MCISIPSRSCATCITSLLHTNHVSPQHMSWLLHPTSIQVQKISSQLHPSPISPYSGLMMCTSTQSRSHLSPTQMSNPDPGHEICISPPKRFPLTCIQVAGFTSQLHPGAISLPFKSENLHLNSIYVLSLPHLHPGHISSQSRPKYLHLTSIQMMSITHVRHTSIQVLSHLHPNSNILISLPSMYCLTSIQVRSFMSHLHPCDISHLQPIHFHSSHDICITAPSMPYLTPICVSILAPELHPDHVSPPSKSHDLCLISIQVTPQPIPLHLSSS